MIALILKAIAIATLATGALQIAVPSAILGLIGAQPTPPLAAYFFGIIGMFMMLFGGLLLHALRGPGVERLPVFWAGLQKLGASLAVAMAVAKGLLIPLALAVAAFDLASGVLVFFFLYRVKDAALTPLATR